MQDNLLSLISRNVLSISDLVRVTMVIIRWDIFDLGTIIFGGLCTVILGKVPRLGCVNDQILGKHASPKLVTIESSRMNKNRSYKNASKLILVNITGLDGN